MAQAAVEAGAPENTIGCITKTSMPATNELMHCKEVKMIIATGGPGMVKAAYSAGKPALGVGAGNSPAYIERTANIKQAVTNIIASKTFDYGTICASEQSIICEECNKDAVIAELKAQGAYFMSPEETDKVCKLLFKNGGHAMNAKFVGRSPLVIASAAGISVPENTTVLIGPQGGVGDGYPLSYEKLTTVLAFYVVKDWHEACDLSIALLQNGIGHTMSLHTEDRNIILEFTRTWGGSSTSENVSPLNLINIKKVAFGLKNCATMVADDPTFNHPELGSIPGAFGNTAVNTQRISASAPTACAGNAYLSPEQYQNGGCTTGCKNGANIGDEIDAKQLNEIVEMLAKVLRGE